MNRFQDKVALVTGAASGIGRATALRLGAEGATLVLSDLDESGLTETATMVTDAGGTASVHRANVADEAEVAALMDAAVTIGGRLDVLCNVAGILRFDHTHELTLENWNKVLAVNLTGTFLMCRAAIPHLLATRGNIVNVASMAAIKGQPWTAAYSASKGGVLSLTLNIAVDYMKQGLRCNAVCPGGVATPMVTTFALPEGADPKLLRRVTPPMGMQPPDTIASVIAMLASSDAAHITGEYVRVDGGTTV